MRETVPNFLKFRTLCPNLKDHTLPGTKGVGVTVTGNDMDMIWVKEASFCLPRSLR